MAAGNNRGGRKTQSGRKPGTDRAGFLPDLPTRSPANAQVAGASIPEAHIAACRMRARGVPFKRIGELLGGKDWETIKRWTELHPEIIEREIDLLVDPKQAFKRFAPDVLEGYERVIQDPEHPAHGTILRDTADRIWDKPIVRQPSSGTGPPSITIISQIINNAVAAPEPLTIQGEILDSFRD